MHLRLLILLPPGSNSPPRIRNGHEAAYLVTRAGQGGEVDAGSAETRAFSGDKCLSLTIALPCKFPPFFEQWQEGRTQGSGVVHYRWLKGFSGIELPHVRRGASKGKIMWSTNIA